MAIRTSVRVDAARRLGPLRRIWTSIGYDEINWTYTRRGQALYATLRELAEAPYHVRNHNALTSGNGLSEPARGSTNVYQERPDGSAFCGSPRRSRTVPRSGTTTREGSSGSSPWRRFSRATWAAEGCSGRRSRTHSP